MQRRGLLVGCRITRVLRSYKHLLRVGASHAAADVRRPPANAAGGKAQRGRRITKGPGILLAQFIAKHLIEATDVAFDDFAGAESDAHRNRRILGLDD
ncbi:MAG: hypothetical protein ACYSWU_03970 [Planctomycetota bacterium]